MTRKQEFIEEYNNHVGNISYIIVAIELPQKSTEIITNAYNLGRKFAYYCENYDDNLCLKSNTNIKIINYMMV